MVESCQWDALSDALYGTDLCKQEKVDEKEKKRKLIRSLLEDEESENYIKYLLAEKVLKEIEAKEKGGD